MSKRYPHRPPTITGVKSWSVIVCGGVKHLFVGGDAALGCCDRPCGDFCRGAQFHELDRVEETEEQLTSRGEPLSELRAQATKEWQ
jgi:hypothetical protein